MAEADSIDDILEEWYRKFRKIKKGLHLLCPKVSDDDTEDYDDPEPSPDLSADEKKRRKEDAEERFVIVAWTSLVFGAGQDKAGIWLVNFSERLEQCLQTCDKCVLNWHMRRKKLLEILSESVLPTLPPRHASEL